MAGELLYFSCRSRRRIAIDAATTEVGRTSQLRRAVPAVQNSGGLGRSKKTVSGAVHPVFGLPTLYDMRREIMSTQSHERDR